jgi:simple sugar transport system ATP-binding protein
VEPLIRMQDISKSFGAIRALRNINLEIGYGEVLGLVGDNAAGKSTLVKIINGSYTPDSGVIQVEGERVDFKSPMDSRNMGIEMIYQDFALVENLSISANIFLGKEATFGFGSPLSRFLNRRVMAREAKEILEDLGIEFDSVDVKVADLSGGGRQLVAVARAIYFRPKLILMDEPTANLSLDKIDRLLRIVNDMKSRGISIVLISHRLQDITAVSDRIAILRHGMKVCDAMVQNITIEDMLKMMMIDTASEDAAHKQTRADHGQIHL